MWHANIETTMDIYTEVTKSKKKEAIENLYISLMYFMKESLKLGTTSSIIKSCDYNKFAFYSTE